MGEGDLVLEMGHRMQRVPFCSTQCCGLGRQARTWSVYFLTAIPGNLPTMPLTTHRPSRLHLLAPGEGRMEACLQDHREEDGFSDRCREALEERMERQAADYELNYGLRWVAAG